MIDNGAAGVMFRFAARSILGAFTVVDGIEEVDLIADPDKLRRLGLV